MMHAPSHSVVQFSKSSIVGQALDVSYVTAVLVRRGPFSGLGITLSQSHIFALQAINIGPLIC